MQSLLPNLEIIVLAAGKGTRMHSALPKVLHALAGRPLMEHVLRAAAALKPRAVHAVYGHGGELLPQRMRGFGANWVLQAEQRGTGHAVQQALPAVAPNSLVLVLYGDVPLITPDTLTRLIAFAERDALALLTVDLPDPTGYGRIIRDAAGRVTRIVEHRDAAPAQRAIRESNTGILAAPARRLKDWVSRLTTDNAQGEYYLTDIVALAVADGATIEAIKAENPWEIMGVNTKAQLAELERVAQLEQARALMERGVTLRDPARFDLRGQLTAGHDVVIDVNVVIEGEVVLGDRVHIEPNTIIRNARIGNDVVVRANCVIEGADIGDGCVVGPFARIRPDTRLAPQAHIGNFVEIKKSDVGPGSKINHLSYIGDTTVGKNVNIGAGTITCNYDGAQKHRTVIGDDAFVGSDTQLVAPVTVGRGATIGAGSTITADAPPEALTLSRVKQKSILGWKRPTKRKENQA